jgi:hypothetical protein
MMLTSSRTTTSAFFGGVSDREVGSARSKETPLLLKPSPEDTRRIKHDSE